MPIPIFALAWIASSAGIARMSSNCRCTDGNIGVRQIDLVDHRNDREALFVREMHVRHRLRFHALRRIDDQQRALARRQTARNFVGKIDVPRRIEQIQPIGLARLRCIIHRHRMRLDRDAALPLQVHRIEQLVLPIALLDGARALQQPVRQRRLAVIDVRDDAKIARQLNGHESGTIRVWLCAVNRYGHAICPLFSFG